MMSNILIMIVFKNFNRKNVYFIAFILNVVVVLKNPDSDQL